MYFTGLLLLIAALPLSLFVMSIAQILLLANWLAEGKLAVKLQQFFNNKLVLAFCLIYLVHVTGLLYTSDFDYALKDLRTKVPLLLLPLIISTSDPISKNSRLTLIFLYIASVLGGSIASTCLYFTVEYSDIRYIFPYISHIIFSLNVVLAIVLLAYLIAKPQKVFNIPKILYYCLILWFIVFLFMAQSLTGIGILGGISLVFLLHYLHSHLKLGLRLAAYTGVMFLLFLCIQFIHAQYKEFEQPEKIDFKTLDQFSQGGNPYYNDTSSKQIVNGHPLWIYICEPELRKAWNLRSHCPFDSMVKTGFDIKNVLFRYMTSRGLRKDSVGFYSLTDNEISHIELACTDVRDLNDHGIAMRIRQVFWEIQNYSQNGNASGFSVMMRIEYWKASLALISRNPILGVGTGDMNTVFSEYYEETHAKLSPEWRRRSHNQYLSITVGLGIIGLFVFLFALFYPAFKLGQLRPGLFFCFLMILLLAMLAEDTIESQAGVSFAAFFYCFFLFVPEEK